MAQKSNKQKIPLIYAYIYMKVKKQMRGNRISGSDLRKIIQKIILCDKDKGTKGLPRRYCYDIIKDLVDLELIEMTGRIHRDLIYEGENKNVLEVVERLKGWKIDKKLRENSKVKENLSVEIGLLDKDPLYKVVKSQCDKELKQAFW